MHRRRHGDCNNHRACMMGSFGLEIDGAAIALITWDMPGRSMNVIDEGVMDELEAIVARIQSDSAITGAIITSGKPAFSAGADLTMLSAYTDRERDAGEDA